MPVESTFCELHLTHGAETKDSISSFYLYPFEIVSTEGFTSTDCAHFVFNSISLQLIPAYSSQSSSFAQTLAGVGLSESE